MKEVRNVRNDIDAAALNKYHIRIIVLVAALTIFDGYDNFIAAYVIHFTKDTWRLSLTQAGFLVSSGLIGFMAGALFNGSIADRFGRKPTLIGALLVAGVFSMLTGLVAHSWATFLVLRVLTGVGLGVILPLSTAFVNEFMPKRVSNVTAIVATGGYNIGGVLAGLAGVFLTQSHGWEVLFLIGGLAIPIAILCVFFLPESPLFLVAAGRTGQALKLMRSLVPGVSYDKATLVLDEDTKNKGSIFVLLNAKNRRATLLIWAAETLILFNAYGLIGWIPTVMIARGESFASGFSLGALLQITSLVGALACGFAADRTASRQLALSLWWGLGSLSLIGLALVNSHFTNIALVALCGFLVSGPLLVLGNLVAQLFDTEVRSTAVGVALGIGRTGGIIGPVAAGWIQQSTGDTRAMFLVMAGACVLSAAAVAHIKIQPDCD